MMYARCRPCDRCGSWLRGHTCYGTPERRQLMCLLAQREFVLRVADRFERVLNPRIKHGPIIMTGAIEKVIIKGVIKI